jgi:hypothetical protein
MERERIGAYVVIAFMILSSLGYAFMSGLGGPSGDSGGIVFKYPSIPGLDFSGLPEEGVKEVLEILYTEECTCGCGLGSLADCRNLDPTCGYSLNRGQEIINEIKAKYGAVMDTDSDGMTDSEEWLRGTDPNSNDTDGDGISDYEEVGYGTDPLNPESVAGIKRALLDLADQRLKGAISAEEFKAKDEEYRRLLGILETIEGEKAGVNATAQNTSG